MLILNLELEDVDIFNLKLLVSKKSPSLRYLRKKIKTKTNKI
jgi:hypothetical protein